MARWKRKPGSANGKSSDSGTWRINKDGEYILTLWTRSDQLIDGDFHQKISKKYAERVEIAEINMGGDYDYGLHGHMYKMKFRSDINELKKIKSRLERLIRKNNYGRTYICDFENFEKAPISEPS